MTNVVVIEHAGKGAMAHYVFQLARGLAASGANVTLITAADYELKSLPHPFRVEATLELWDPKPAGRLSSAWWAVLGRKVRRIGRALRYYQQWLRLIRRVGELRPDVVQLGDIRFPTDLLPLLLLRRKARILADVCHNVRPYTASGTFDRSWLRAIFYRRIYRLFDVVFVHFERNRREFRDAFDVPDARIGTIVHGNEEIFGELADPAVDERALRRRIGIGEDERVVLFFGTLSRYKGTDILLHAFPRIHAGSGARLVLTGFPSPGFDVDAHKELTRTLGIEHAVTWVPEYVPSEHVAAWMRLASAVVFPYRDVYQSGALHVAQTFGVPIVATNAGAMPDVIEHEVSGLLVPSEDHDAVADAVLRLLTDRDLARRLGARAAADAQGRFSWKTIGQTMLERYAVPR